MPQEARQQSPFGVNPVCWGPWGNSQPPVFWEKRDLAVSGAGIHEPPAGPAAPVKRKGSVAGAGHWVCVPASETGGSLLGQDRLWRRPGERHCPSFQQPLRPGLCSAPGHPSHWGRSSALCDLPSVGSRVCFLSSLWRQRETCGFLSPRSGGLGVELGQGLGNE